jgi:anti-anti-sigma regulatory factor
VEGNDLVVVDLCAATFIDSSFLSCLLIAEKDATERGHELRPRLRPNITAVLKTTGITERLTVVTTLEEALL